MTLDSVIESFCSRSTSHREHTGNAQNPHGCAIVPSVPSVPSHKHIDGNEFSETGKQDKKPVTATYLASEFSGNTGNNFSLNEAKLESFVERAAIMEFDGELPRQEAEYMAFRLTWPGGSCTMVGAPSTVEEALEHARLVFGDQCQALPIEASRERNS